MAYSGSNNDNNAYSGSDNDKSYSPKGYELYERRYDPDSCYGPCYTPGDGKSSVLDSNDENNDNAGK